MLVTTRRSFRANTPLLSVVGLLGRPVRTPEGEVIGRIADLVCALATAEARPPVTDVVARVAGRDVRIPLRQAALDGRGATLTKTRLDLTPATRHHDELRLAEVLDRQLVDREGRRVGRTADLFLADAGEGVRLVAADASVRGLLRRLGPVRATARPRPTRLVAWPALAEQVVR